MVEQHSVCNLIGHQKRTYHLGPGKKQLLIASYTFDQSVEDIFSPLLLGATLVLADKLDLMSHLKTVVQQRRITHLAGTPTMVNLMQPGGMPTLEVLMLGGEAISESTKSAWEPHVELWNTYGSFDVGQWRI